MARVFISYANRDGKSFVEQLDADLEKAGHDVFYDAKLAPGQSWATMLESELRSADFVLSILTPDGVKSAWVQQEWTLALQAELENGKVKLIPIKLGEIPDAPPELKTKRWIDFSHDYKSALVELEGVLNRPQKLPLTEAESSSLRQRLSFKVEAFRGTGDGRVKGEPSPWGTGVGSKKKGFMVMPFGKQALDSAYEDYIKPIAEECGLEMRRGDDAFGSHAIIDDIRKSIDESDLVIADLTGRNPNVFYEVGMCHALNKKVLLLSQSQDDIPFDVRHLRVLIYNDSLHGAKLLEKNLRSHLESIFDVKTKAAGSK